jgi:S1-C subfamily serine protease
MVIRRSGQSINAALKLPADWKSRDDISWRASAWGFRRMVTGGLLLEPVEGSRRGSNGIPVEGMALRVKHVGQWDKHAAAKNAGFQQDDVLVSFAGRSDLMTDSDVLRYGLQNSKPGDTVDVELIRAGRKMTLKLPMQD